LVFVTRKALSRRAVLRGLGASVALPLLDGMVPALTPLVQTEARPEMRLGIVYVGMGVASGHWAPSREGAGFVLTPILEPLASFQDQMLVLTGLRNEPADARQGEPAGGHGRISPAFLTGVHARPTEGIDLRAGVSIDQIVARQLGRSNALPSLELCMEPPESAGGCDIGYACTYTNTLCWRTPTSPLPMEHNPRAVFETLFSGTGSGGLTARLKRLRQDRSILDAIAEKTSRLVRQLSAPDRLKLTEYLEAIRDVERRIQNAEAESARELPLPERPVAVPRTFDEYVRLMIDLQVLAFQANLTRVITFMMARELSLRSYPETGVPDAHHPLSHHGNNAGNLKRLATVNAYHVRMLAYFLERLQSTPDGEGSLLDHTLLLYGSGMGDSNKHDTHDLPILLLGPRHITGGRHIRCAKDTPLSNLYVTMLDMLGIPEERFGNSTGTLAPLSIG
jgi:hypothetical protein